MRPVQLGSSILDPNHLDNNDSVLIIIEENSNLKCNTYISWILHGKTGASQNAVDAILDSVSYFKIQHLYAFEAAENILGRWKKRFLSYFAWKLLRHRKQESRKGLLEVLEKVATRFE